MIFINRYSKPNNSIYYFSNSFREDDEQFILSAGQVQTSGLITKIDSETGNVIWEKSYSLSSLGPKTDIIIRRIIRTSIERTPGQFVHSYVGHLTNGADHYIFGLNIDNGNVLWNKKISLSDDVTVHIEPSLASYGFYLCISASASSKTTISPFIGVFNFSGTLQAGIVLGFPGAMVTAFKSHYEGLVLSTRHTTSGIVNVVSLMHSLSIVESYTINSPSIRVDGITAMGALSYKLIASYTSQTGGICLLHYSSPMMDGDGWKLYDFPKRGIKSSAIQNEGIYDYIIEHDSQDCLFHKVMGTDIIWSKRIVIDGNSGGINKFEVSAETESIDFPISSGVTSTVSHTDLNLTTCKTQQINSGVLTEKPISASTVSIVPSPGSYSLTNVTLTPITVSSAKVQICPSGGTSIDTGGELFLQSGQFYLQAAGSTGGDSTAGIHLRWILKNELAEHLPKGDYYQGAPSGFNRENDYVKLYRAPYDPVSVVLNLTSIPNAVVDNQALWLYELGSKKFYVYFRNTTRYQQVRSTVNPLVNPSGFLSQYGNNLIEIENRDSLFFASQITVSNTNGHVKTEISSIETNKVNLPKFTTFRKDLLTADFAKKIYAENGRSIRYAAFSCYVTQVSFEFYEDFIGMANNLQIWNSLGQFSLSTNDTIVHARLDPDDTHHPIHANWLRYNDGEYVNIRNYIKKWNGELDDPRNRIKDSVERYIELSEDPNNPLANEIYYLNDNEPDPEDETENALEISHLVLLQMASLDFHVSRMLGLGSLDFAEHIFTGGKFIYAVQYITEGDIGDGQGAREIKHLSLSLPTSMEDERLSLPIVLKEPVPGILSSDTEIGNGQVITDEDGYSHDGRSRFLSLFVKELTPDEPENSPFYHSSLEFNMSEFTYPVFVGIEYRSASDSNWRIPELPNDRDYKNVDAQGNASGNETAAIALPEVGQPAFVHRETHSGIHVYGSYGVNWFSRATSSQVTWEVETDIEPANNLLPPASGNAILIQQESPLLLTSQNEQILLNGIVDDDKTLIRLTFNYDCSQDMISYHKAIDGVILQDFEPLPDNEEIFADEVEIFFRPKLPAQVFGVVKNVSDLPGNPLVAIIETDPLQLNSEGENQFLYPTISAGDIPNYIGGIFKVGADEYIIHHIEIPGSDPLLPIFHILKKQVGDAFGETGSSYDPGDFIIPEADQTFMVIENMLNTSSWGTVNPHPLKVQIGDNWPVHTEEVTVTSGEGDDTQTNTYFRKFRGIVFNSATVKKYTDEFAPVFEGLYEITFAGYNLPSHPQDTIMFPPDDDADFVQWYSGSIRIPYEDNPNGERKTLKVLRIDNSGSSLKVYALDENYQSEPLQNADQRTSWVHYYPGYRVYLYHNEPCRLTEDDILPQEENALEKYSIFGLRSRISGNADYISRISTTLMFARKLVGPETPKQPKGALYATRPDYFGKSTYTFTTEYGHKPFSVTFLRSNSDILLSIMFKQTPYGQEPVSDSVEDILVKNNDEYFNNRLIDLANVTIDSGSQFPEYNSYRFPLPNNPKFFESINRFIQEHNDFFDDNIPLVEQDDITNMDYVIIPEVPNRNDKLTFYNFVKQAIVSSFVPLTEIPVIYQYIKGGDYRPIPKAQVIRDRNGVFLNPTDPEFDMAPMVKIMGTSPHKTLFTDFTLDGASTSLYFYAVKETDAQMQASNLSEVIGPVKLVNTYALKTPEIKSIIPVLENPVLGIQPAMRLEINSYDSVYQVKKVKIYRALNMRDATTVRSMTLVKSIDLETEEMMESTIWLIEDDFNDLSEIPFGDPLYYRVIVEAQVEYAEPNYDYSDNNPENEFVIVIDYASSEASKLMITTITENVLPSSPNLTYNAATLNSSTLSNVVLKWSEQAYKGKYHLYKMNSQGNWFKIATVQSNDEEINLPLIETDWDTDQLIIQDSEGNPIYHHFKVVVENTAGMQSIEENILTIGNE